MVFVNVDVMDGIMLVYSIVLLVVSAVYSSKYKESNAK